MTDKFTTVDVPTGPNGGPPYITVTAEYTDTPGLVISPRLMTPTGADSGFVDGFGVRHAPSGLYIPGGDLSPLPIEAARRAAKALGRLAVDWTAPKAAVLHQIRALSGGRSKVQGVIDAARVDPDDEYDDDPDDWDGDDTPPEPGKPIDVAQVAAL